MISIQTNVDSLTAQQNLNVNSQFQSKTIQQLTSGYRINSSADDAAGLAVANKFRDDISELTQGVQNANDGVSQLQIVDGGLSNISNILDRLKTLATESASNTFTGNRQTLNNEYQSLLGEINRQASNIGLVNGGSMNKQLQVYIGGGSSQANAQVAVDLSGTPNQVDSAGLGIGSTNVNGGGVVPGGAGDLVTSLNNANETLLGGNAAGSTENFTIAYVDSGGAEHNLTASVSSSNTSGITVAQALSQLNTQLGSIGLQAGVNSSGQLVVGGSTPFDLTASNTTNGGNTIINDGTLNTINTGAYNITNTAYTKADVTAQTLEFSNGTVTKFVTLDGSQAAGNNAGATSAEAAQSLNTALSSIGIAAFSDTNGAINLQSSSAFTVTVVTAGADAGGVAGFDSTSATAGTTLQPTAPDQTQSVTGNALAALTSIESAVGDLGQVQGRVGAGENQLNYAINLAQSQITNFSAAESQIRDADVASDAANLSKSQVLQQASIAAMAQANAEPQAILALLKG